MAGIILDVFCSGSFGIGKNIRDVEIPYGTVLRTEYVSTLSRILGRPEYGMLCLVMLLLLPYHMLTMP